MGLDVFAYRNLVAAANVVVNEENYDEYVHFYLHPAFPERAEGIDTTVPYTGDYIDGPSFSYGGYSRWRNELAKMAGYQEGPTQTTIGMDRNSYCAPCWNGETGPFSEQINFSDCEGTIGPVVARKLHQDYVAFDEQAQAVGDWFYKPYAKFRAIFDSTEGDRAIKFG